MSYENLIYETKDEVAKITINRPQALNALHPELLKEIKAAVDEAGRDDDVGVVVLTGAGRAFSAGVDLVSISERDLEKVDAAANLNRPAHDLIEAIEALPKVVIGMVNGYCITGGLELMLACDLVVASKEAMFADTHTKWGLRCTWGMSQRLPRRIGWLKAKELTFTSDMVPADEAERIGLINKAVPADKLEEAVLELAGRILANSRDSVAAHKFLYIQGMKGTMAEGLALEDSTRFEIRDTRDRVARFAKKG